MDIGDKNVGDRFGKFCYYHDIDVKKTTDRPLSGLHCLHIPTIDGKSFFLVIKLSSTSFANYSVNHFVRIIYHSGKTFMRHN